MDPSCADSEPQRQLIEVRESTVRFAGDSGDGMQLVGGQFADLASLSGCAIRTIPDFPSEIRAPAGSLAGVSGYQLNFGDQDITTPGDSPFVLVAMNPAALKVSLPDLQPGGIIILNVDEFTPENLAKAEYSADPLEDGSLSGYRVIPVAISKLTDEATRHTGLPGTERARCKNFFALGMVLWLYDQPMQPLLEWMMRKFRKTSAIMAANGASLRAGHNYANTTELFRVHFHVAAATLPKGRYRRVTGNEALALGLVAASCRAQRPIVYASYPITPASEILHELSARKEFDVRVLQCEDEIAACCAAIGASFAGALGITGTSGPGLALKTEAMGLGVMTELPLVVIDVQRAGPSTGMPTKTEQSDLLAALYGRPGEAPAAVLAPSSPADCFGTAIEAVRLATRYMTPVLLLSDSFLANSAEAFAIPDVASLPDLRVPSASKGLKEFAPYRRHPETLARSWAVPGTEGLEHRIGGLEKQDVTGVVTYDSENHRRMVELRAAKIERIANDIPEAEVSGEPSGELLIVGWGSTCGAIVAAVKQARDEGHSVSHLHLRYLNPLPRRVGEILRAFRRILVPENNTGQLSLLLRSRFQVEITPLPKVEGRPFLVREIRNAIEETLRQ
ncbi:MAG: 2-oxoacid:acceptor oxidoreductase subunit alpha [Verrucomicrobiia bacterium]